MSAALEVPRPDVIGCIKCGFDCSTDKAVWARCLACGKTVGICLSCAGGDCERVPLHTRRFIRESMAWHARQLHGKRVGRPAKPQAPIEVKPRRPTEPRPRLPVAHRAPRPRPPRRDPNYPTRRQQALLAFVQAFVAVKGEPPSLRQIGAHFGFSKQAAGDHLARLEAKGWLRRGGRWGALALVEQVAPQAVAHGG